MTPEDKSLIKQWGQNIAGHPHIRMALTADPRSRAIQGFCGKLKKLAPSVVIAPADGGDEKIPFIEISQRIKFKGVPQGPELKPFLNRINGFPAGEDDSMTPDRRMLEKIRIPALLKVYVSPRCPFCPHAVSNIFMLASLCSLICAEVVDGELFPELAEQEHIRSVPTVILDDQYRFTGAVNPSEIIDMMISRDPSKLSGNTLRKMIEEGRAEDLARMMAQSDAVYPGFMDLLVHSGWPVRLGAMAAFEYLEEISLKLADQARLKLLERFEAADNQVKGDIIYLLAGSTQPDVLSKLRSVVNGPYEKEVRDAAREALASEYGSCLS